jgi:hypothetical protein
LPRPTARLTDDGKIASAIRETGNMFATAFEALRQSPLRGVPVTEFFDQCWFLARVTTLPLILLSIPFGMVIALEVGSLLPADRRAAGTASIYGVVDQTYLNNKISTPQADVVRLTADLQQAGGVWKISYVTVLEGATPGSVGSPSGSSGSNVPGQ